MKEGDTCRSIAESHSIATDRLIAGNALDYNCTTLSAGLDLCIESTCALHTVEVDQTCSEIAQGKGFSILQLTSWNPTIHTNCDNLDSMIGRSICISSVETYEPFRNAVADTISRPPGTSEYVESSMKLNATSTM